MKYYFTDRQGRNTRKLTRKELRERLTERQIAEGEQAKREDPLEEVSCMTDGGIIYFELD